MRRRNYFGRRNLEQNSNDSNEEKIKNLNENLENEKKSKEDLNQKYLSLKKLIIYIRTEKD